MAAAVWSWQRNYSALLSAAGCIFALKTRRTKCPNRRTRCCHFMRQVLSDDGVHSQSDYGSRWYPDWWHPVRGRAIAPVAAICKYNPRPLNASLYRSNEEMPPKAMPDFLSPQRRSRLMSRIRGRNTKPEMVVRKLLWRAGYRYRLHCKELPGKPDVVFPGRRRVIFVHGCFWHRHPGCSRATLPATRREFWSRKLEGNTVRDAQAVEALQLAGWRVLVVWECEIKSQHLLERLQAFLDG